MRVFSWEEIVREGGAAFREFADSVSCAGKSAGTARSALTVGDFDGCHLGHRALFAKVFSAASSPAEGAPRTARKNVPAAHGALIPGAVTFRRTPPADGARASEPVFTLRQKLDALQKSGFVFAVLIDFSDDFRTIKGSAFFEILAENARLGYLAVGEDFRCGFRLDTGRAEIEGISRALDFRFDPLPPVLLDGERVSSTRIRAALLAADFSGAERLLGHPFVLDLSEIAWHRVRGSEADADVSEGMRSAVFSAPVARFQQVLPPAGRYSVELRTESGDNTPAFSCSLDTAERGFIRLECGEIPLDLTENAGFFSRKNGEQYAGLRFMAKIQI